MFLFCAALQRYALATSIQKMCIGKSSITSAWLIFTCYKQLTAVIKIHTYSRAAKKLGLSC